MDDLSPGALLGILLFLLACSAVFSGTETALMCLNRYRLRHLARSGHRGARFAEKLLERPDRLIGVILFCNNLVNNAAATLVAILALRIGGTSGVLVGTVLVTVLLLLFGELMPKTLGATRPERLAFPGAWLYHGLLTFLPPLSWLVRGLTLCSNGILRIFGLHPQDGASNALTIEELRTIVMESGTRLPRKRHEIIMRVLELGDITVDDILIPRTDVVGIDLDSDLSVIIETIRTSGFTRLPVWRDTIDDVVGLLHLKRLVQHSPGTLTKAMIESALDEPYFIPEGTPLNRQLVQFQRARQRTGFVVDEYGDIQGIVTMEDLLEEIVGEFSTEPATGTTDVRRDEAGGGYIVDAAVNVRALNRMMNWKLPTDGPKTLNGLILEKLGAIPRRGARLLLNDYAIEVIETGESAVESVRIRELPQPQPRMAARA